jgi:polysaccharide biosynthesis/export protein
MVQVKMAALTVGLMALVAQVTAQQPRPTPSPTPARVPPVSSPSARPSGGAPAPPGPGDYRIGPEDVLHVSVWQNAELTRSVPVRPDGKISLPLLDDVQAAGLTPTELRSVLLERLKEYIPAAEVSVIVTEVQSFKVSVVGKVRKPDRYRLRSPTSILDVIALAGGFEEDANTDKIVVLRPQPFAGSQKMGATFQRIYFNYKRTIGAGGESENIRLQADDIVVVP